ncbi:hypothetical protein [Mucilaginibacter pedocola]|uniref:Uncharacterized protein n=1 Tax=Mucilaginibacter pedocola TaxID=1792845 RepID=A0A1S9P6B8_9SPHI|nr:hypothetical protein [Mucilaginibacter pedocola]OOQ56494.1 hypothetical protein BC343_18795 [Mucilaginibacter pedocola]
MNLIIAYIFYRIGRKRVIGGFDSFVWGLIIWPIGIFFVLNSRRLDDKAADAYMIEQFGPKQEMH